MGHCDVQLFVSKCVQFLTNREKDLFERTVKKYREPVAYPGI
jgi:hypothetical protein